MLFDRRSCSRGSQWLLARSSGPPQMPFLNTGKISRWLMSSGMLVVQLMERECTFIRKISRARFIPPLEMKTHDSAPLTYQGRTSSLCQPGINGSGYHSC